MNCNSLKIKRLIYFFAFLSEKLDLFNLRSNLKYFMC